MSSPPSDDANAADPTNPTVAAAALPDALAVTAVTAAAPERKKRKGGRRRDEIWKETTVCEDKAVVCNHCHAVIHRYGTTKVERVRAHFENKCLSAKKPRLAASGAVPGSRPGSGAAAVAGAALVLPSAELVPASTPTALALGKPRKPDYGSKTGVFKRRFAHWMYATGQPFENAESELLLGALRVLRADAAPPTREELENELLDLEHSASLAKVHRALAGKKGYLTIEHWVDATGGGNTSFGVVADGAPLFLESVAASASDVGSGIAVGGAGLGEEVALETVEAVLARTKKSVFGGIVSPTTASLAKGTREKLQRKHPQCVFFYGCVCHALRLLMGDMASVLPWLGAATASVAEIVEVFHASHKLQSQLRALQAAELDAQLASPLLPAGGSLCESLESVRSLEKQFYALVARRDFVESSASPEEQNKLKRIQDFVLSESFVQDLTNSLAVLLPLQHRLTQFETTRAPLSQVYASFADLLGTYASMELVTKKEKALITSCVNDRLDAIYSEVHGVAYLLDPLHLGVDLDAVKKREAEAFIVQYCREHLQALPSAQQQRDVDVLAQLDKYKEMVAELKACNATYWGMLAAGTVHPTDFWVERRQFPQLQQLAWAIFDLPAASTAPNVAFGALAHQVHARFHSVLAADKLRKLTHVYCNAKTSAGSGLASLVGDGDAQPLLVHDL